MPARDENSFSSICFVKNEEIIINDIETESSKYIKKIDQYKFRDGSILETNSMIFFPLKIEEKVIGILSIQSYNKKAYTLNDLKKIKVLASYISIAIENSRLYTELEHAAKYDGLTGILNRTEAIKRGENTLLLGNKSQEFGIIMMDIDHFKKINDNYGHQVGDQVLKEVAYIITENTRDYDIVGRYGGEEFLIVLPNTEREKAYAVGERIRIAIETHHFESENAKTIKLTASIGVFSSKKYENTLYGHIKKADKSLYAAKKSGRNKIIEYSSIAADI